MIRFGLILCLVFSVQLGWAQDPWVGLLKKGRSDVGVTSLWTPMMLKVQRSTVRVLGNDKALALGTVVDNQGHVLTKASLLVGELVCQNAEGKTHAARIVKVLKKYDLALLKTDPQGLTPITWRRGKSPAVGALLATPSLDERSPLIGVLSVAPRWIDRVKRKVTRGRSYPAGTASARSEFQNQRGGELSQRRTGFPSALQHDTVLTPEQCGGPLFDLNGKAVGINIARAGRAASYAIPADELAALLLHLLTDKRK